VPRQRVRERRSFLLLVGRVLALLVGLALLWYGLMAAVDVTVRRARNVAGTLKAAQDRVIGALAEHGLPSMPVNVTLSSYDRRERRELQ
jgi:hypothetical protein